jgi:hypothetical protein
MCVAPQASVVGAPLEELLGPPELRPGELHEAYGLPVTPAFRAEAAATRTPVALAVTVVVERELVLSGLAETEASAGVDLLDGRAQMATVRGRISPSGSAYVRELLALLGGHQADVCETAGVVVPVRVADRLRVTAYQPYLSPADIEPALRWELAAVLAGQTVAEWSLMELLRARNYNEAAERQSAALKTAS